MSFVERAGFSTYTSTTIDAPVSLVWAVAIDIEAIPERSTSYISVERIDDDRAVVGGKSSRARRASFAIDDDSSIDYEALEALINSRWKVTSLDPFRRNPLHYIATVTQISVTKHKRSFSVSTSSIGGVTSTVKHTIEPIQNDSNEACRRTTVISVVPNQYFVLGLPFCCFAGFLKRKTQKAFKADSLVFKQYCEDRARLGAAATSI